MINIEVLSKTNWQGYVLLFITSRDDLLCSTCVCSLYISPHYCLICHCVKTPGSGSWLSSKYRSRLRPWLSSSRPALHTGPTIPSYKTKLKLNCGNPLVTKYCINRQQPSSITYLMLEIERVCQLIFARSDSGVQVRCCDSGSGAGQTETGARDSGHETRGYILSCG